MAQAAWSAVLVLSAKADALVNYTGFAVVLFSGIAGVALFVLRRRHPGEARPFRAWGYPVAPGIFVMASALIVLNAIWRNPKPSGAGVAIILGGTAALLVSATDERRRQRQAEAHGLRLRAEVTATAPVEAEAGGRPGEPCSQPLPSPSLSLEP